MAFIAQIGQRAAARLGAVRDRRAVGVHLRHALRHGGSRRRCEDRREVERHPVRRHGQAARSALMQAMMLFALMLIGRQLKFGSWYHGQSAGGGDAVSLPAVADPQSRACRQPARLPEQSLRGHGDLHRHPARVRLPRERLPPAANQPPAALRRPTPPRAQKKMQATARRFHDAARSQAAQSGFLQRRVVDAQSPGRAPPQPRLYARSSRPPSAASSSEAEPPSSASLTAAAVWSFSRSRMSPAT